MIRRLVERAHDEDIAFASCSSRTLVLKGMLGAPQLPRYFPDLRDPRAERDRGRALALLDQHVPELAARAPEPLHRAQRRVQHAARQPVLAARPRAHAGASSARPGEGAPAPPGESDSASFDRVLELLVMAGRSLPHALMMLVPEAWEGRDDLPEALTGFYAYHEKVMEPWDGPASITFSDGRMVGAKLDRNGLRPGRWLQTDDGWVVLASETGAMPVDPERVVKRGRLKPGSLWIVDLERGRCSPIARWSASRLAPPVREVGRAGDLRCPTSRSRRTCPRPPSSRSPRSATPARTWTS